MVGGDADAVVSHLQLDRLAGVTNHHLDGPTRPELDGVSRAGSSPPAPTCSHPTDRSDDGLGQSTDRTAAGAGQIELEVLHHVADQRPEVHLGGRDGRLSLLDARHVEQLVDQVLQPRGAAQDALEAARVRRGASGRAPVR